MAQSNEHGSAATRHRVLEGGTKRGGQREGEKKRKEERGGMGRERKREEER